MQGQGESARQRMTGRKWDIPKPETKSLYILARLVPEGKGNEGAEEGVGKDEKHILGLCIK